MSNYLRISGCQALFRALVNRLYENFWKLIQDVRVEKHEQDKKEIDDVKNLTEIYWK
jgi:hypothetical protein